MASVGHWQRHLQLPIAQISSPLAVSGTIKSLIHQEQQLRFNFLIDTIDGRSLLWPIKVRLSWAVPTWSLKQGQTATLMVKLKPPHGLANEGGFHYQQWLFSQGIIASGYVKNNPSNTLLYRGASLRQSLLDRLLSEERAGNAWLAALALGYRGLLQPSDWQLVQNTGIAHLIAISGLHLALVASFSFALFGGLLLSLIRYFLPSHFFNWHKMTLCFVLLTTLTYSSLAGFALPTLRAWLMLLLFSGIVLLNNNWSAKRVLVLSVCIFLTLFPLSIYGLSFWLSFSAVIIIGFVFWRWPSRQHGFSLSNFFLILMRIQLALCALMLPLVAWQFSYVSIVSPLVNLIAVPLVTMLLVPLCLLGIFLFMLNTDLASITFNLAASITQFCLLHLERLSTYEWASINIHAIPAPVWLCSSVALFMLFSPTFVVPKKLICILLFPLATYFLPSINKHWKVDVLDVGQGLAVLISKNGHAILYDTGATYPSGFNMADAVILPILQARGLSKLDAVFISHDDNDHIGGLTRLRQEVEIQRVISTDTICLKGWQQNWQGLKLRVLWPDQPDKYNDNNSSCVLHISDSYNSVLLPGDIDASIETKLVDLYGKDLEADVLLAPHHGSNTSSSSVFIEAVDPQHVVFSQGFMNRWQFPRKEVLGRYPQGIELYTSSEHGQVSFLFLSHASNEVKVSSFRQNLHPYWYANHQ
jgi:competence protein ComEC